ncbi:hypothetical protein IEQ34_022201 [Dendrobium chrysotoxum]|uniref:Uncharacterized protein n=1 Tax=Dendrobium chrysotoxum TaxID=161865 RepID=A0AAV7FX59_DENCH|nr:hypothetical protein IEQ34_022201 [Dendrobium chrysotoxum]
MGLRDELRHPLVPLRIGDFFEFVERARLIKNDMLVSQFKWDMSRKRLGAEMTRGPLTKHSNTPTRIV